MHEATAQRRVESVTPAAHPQVTERTTCRSCGSSRLAEVLDFGNRYISNFPDTPDAFGSPRAPLKLVLCTDCTLLQLRHTVPSEWLYRRYWYRSGVNASMCQALSDIARCGSEFADLTSGDSVLDIGCNDGTLLRAYSVSGIRRVGFEPAENLQSDASRGIDRVIPDFFSARSVAGEKFRVITSIAMFYDLEDPNAFVADIASVLDLHGVWVIEMHYLPLTLSRNAFDAVCHEHLEYYSLRSLEVLLARHGLVAADVVTNEVNGGSVRIYVVHRGSQLSSFSGGSERVAARRAQEDLLKLDYPQTYEEFGARVRRIGTVLNGCLARERAEGKEIYVYGASTKGNTLLQVFDIDHSLVRGAAERNPEKWGKFTVGTWIPIVSEDEARIHADDFLILPWHFLPGICDRERNFLARGGKLIVPLPEPHFIDALGVHPLG